MDMGGIQLNLDLAADLPPAHCDPAQIEQVVLAMVINAIDAMPQGGNLWISTQVTARPAMELIIRDDGMGIPTSTSPISLSRFTRPRNPAARAWDWPSARTLWSATAATIDVDLRGRAGNDFQDFAAGG